MSGHDWGVVLSCGRVRAGGEDFDELEVYGSGQASVQTLASYKFQVFDSLLNIGPISNLTVSQPAFLSVSLI